MQAPPTPTQRRPQRPGGRRNGKPPRVQVEISAGGIVYKRTRKGLKMSLMLDPFGKWTFAKGHVEPGETIEQAALRETAEEMSLRGLKLRQPLGTIDFWFREKYRVGSKGMLIHKFVHYFLMEAPSGEWGSPQKHEKIRKIIWVDPQGAMQKSSYEDVRPVLEKALITLGVRRPPAVAKPPQHHPKPRP
jgi:ADP-ribose pyrophosphatase YjhB (NUDIX family)